MTTSMPRRSRSCARMPLSIASCTTMSAVTGAAAEQTPSAASSVTRSLRPARYRARRDSPVLRCCANFFSEEVPEDAAAGEQVGRLAVFDDDAVVDHDRAIGDLDGRE